MSREFVLKASITLPLGREAVFEFFAAAENLGRITPPELRWRIRSVGPVNIQRGTLIDYTISLWGLPMPWRTEITVWNPPAEFEDTQRRGPYTQWIHRHTFTALDAHTTRIDDVVRYRLPLGTAGLLAQPIIRRQLLRIFEYRQLAVPRELATTATNSRVTLE